MRDIIPVPCATFVLSVQFASYPFLAIHHASSPTGNRTLDRHLINHSIFNLQLIALGPADRCGAVVKVLCCKSEGRWLDPRWYHWSFSLT